MTADRERFDAAPCGLLQTSEDGTIRDVNRTFCAWTGYAVDELVDRRRLQDLLTVGGRIFHHTHWAPLLRMQGSLSEVKLEVVHRDGRTLPMVLNAARREDGGTCVHEIAAFVARDRDRYEQELVRSRRRLEELVAEANELHATAKDRALFAEQMIGIVSHDLRNPLNAIQMGTALLRAQLTPNQQRVIDRINRATDRASRLIGDLLDFTQARLGTGIVVQREPLELHEAIDEAVDELRLAYPQRTIVHVRRGGGTCVGDASRIVQLLGNLISNAVAYGDPGQPITATSMVDETGCAVAVHNTGNPIPPEVQTTLFEPMTRGHSSGSAARSVGLGLYIVREIARAHVGTVRVVSTTEAGTTFEVAWPSQCG